MRPIFRHASMRKERLQPLLVLHGFAEEPALLSLAARVAASGAGDLRGALRHLHRELCFDLHLLEGKELPGQRVLNKESAQVSIKAPGRAVSLAGFFPWCVFAASVTEG